jgi:hypothetical protein
MVPPGRALGIWPEVNTWWRSGMRGTPGPVIGHNHVGQEGLLQGGNSTFDSFQVGFDPEHQEPPEALDLILVGFPGLLRRPLILSGGGLGELPVLGVWQPHSYVDVDSLNKESHPDGIQALPVAELLGTLVALSASFIYERLLGLIHADPRWPPRPDSHPGHREPQPWPCPPGTRCAAGLPVPPLAARRRGQWGWGD